MTEIPKIFTDVVVWISPIQWNRAMQLGGAKIEVLADNLARLHKEDFGAELARDRSPRYVVSPDPGLEPGTVVFQFGLGVFVPGDADLQIATVHLKAPGQDYWRALPDWSFRRLGKGLARPAALYENQQFLLLGPRAALRPPIPSDGGSNWFPGGDGHIWMNMNIDNTVQCFGDGRHIRDGEIMKSENSLTVFGFHRLWDSPDDGAAPEEMLQVRIETDFKPSIADSSPKKGPHAASGGVEKAEDAPVMTPRSASRPTLKPSPPTKEPSARLGRTIIPGRRYPRLALAGLALPRIDTPEGRVNGLEGWAIWLDSAGKLVNQSAASQQNTFAHMMLTASHKEGSLLFRSAGDSHFMTVSSLPFQPPDFPKGTIQVLPSPIPQQHHGFLMLNAATSFPLNSERKIIGRSGAESDAHRADIRLDFLTNPDGLKWHGGSGHQGYLLGDYMLSRRHAAVWCDGDQLAVELEAGGVPIHLLDIDLKLTDTLVQSGDCRKLSPNTSLAIGCYLLRFELMT